MAAARGGGALAVEAFTYELTAAHSLTTRRLDFSQPFAATEIFAVTEFTVVSPGTELAAWTGKPPLRPGRVYPRLVGYCNLARVVEVGSAVTSARAGDYILTHQSHCSHFRCAEAEILLTLRDVAREVRKRVTTVYLYHLGYASLLGGGYVPGSEVAVIGCGALGFATASLVSVFGGHPVVFTARAARVEAMLPGATVLAKEVPAAAFWETHGDLGGADLVVGTSDAWSDYLLGLQVVRKGGTIMLLGFPGRGEPQPPSNPLEARFIYDKQLTLRQAGSVAELDVAAHDVRFTLKRNLRYLARLVRDGRIDPGPLISLQVPPAALADAYEALHSRKTASLSALIEWPC